MTEIKTTISLRLRDKHASKLKVMAGKVNFIWNYLNETQRKRFKDNSHKELKERFFTRFDLINLLSGTCRVLNINSEMANPVATEYSNSRKKSKKAWLRFRNKKMLGWVPFRGEMVGKTGKKFVRIGGVNYELMEPLKLPEGAKFIDGGSFAEDSLGHWYINLVIKYESEPVKFQSSGCGVDPGLKTMAVVASNKGTITKIHSPRIKSKHEDKLKQLDSRIAKGENKNGTKSKKLVRERNKLNLKISNTRQHHSHVASHRLAKAHQVIKFGDLDIEWLVSKGYGISKSALDTALGDFKRMIHYKSVMNGGEFHEVNESYTTQTCSNCNEITQSSPKGAKGLGIRKWRCDHCGSVHDRDANAAINISRVESDPPVGGIANQSVSADCVSTGHLSEAMTVQNSHI